MTKSHSLSALHDVIGIGFGPSNLALAIALDELSSTLREPLSALFLEKQQHYQWHGNTLVNQSEMQISFLKDLVSLRNPTSPYSFVNYLHEMDRLVDFINLRTFYPSRMEYNDYLRWVASHFSHQCRGGQDVSRVELDTAPGGGACLRITASDPEGQEHAYRARAIVLSTGGTPRIPPAFEHLRGDRRVFHHARYLEGLRKLRGSAGGPARIAVVGAGQSAAEAFIDLHDNHPEVEVDLIIRGSALKPADDSPFVNEIFSPRYTDLVFDQEGPERERLIREFHNTNYSVVDAELIERIYAILYKQKVSGHARHRFLPRHEVLSATAGDDAVELGLRVIGSGRATLSRYQGVVLATGYDRLTHRQILAPIAPHLGEFEVDRRYRVLASEHFEPAVFMQGFCQDSHGLSDTLLSVLPNRSAEIAQAVLDAVRDPGTRARDTGTVAAALSLVGE